MVRQWLVALLLCVSCGNTTREGQPSASAGATSAPQSGSGGQTAGGSGGHAGGSDDGGSGGGSGDAAGGVTTDAAGAGGEAEGGAGGAVELVCEIYPFEECLDGLSNESYSCCPVTGGPCVV